MRDRPAKSDENSTPRLPATDVSPNAILERVRSGANEALALLDSLDPRDVAAALLVLEPSRRLEVLELSDRVDEILPILTEVEFTMTLSGAGIEDAGWLVEFASPEQRVAAIDLDCWRGRRFSESRFFQWVDAMIEAGTETLAGALVEIDAEVWSIGMRAMGEFGIAGLGFDGDGGGDGLGGTTLDGVVFFEAHSAENEDRIREILTAALHYAPSEYWKLVYGALRGNDAQSREWANRWQRNRLADLGFPEPEHAVRVYQPLRVDEVAWPDVSVSVTGMKVGSRSESESESELESGAVVIGSLTHSVSQALGELAAGRRDEVLGYILAVANTITVADQLALADPETPKRSLQKALRGIERGMSEVATYYGRTAGAVLDGITPAELFRIGVTLDWDLHPQAPSVAGLDAAARAEAANEDWNVETMTLDDDDLD